jgi:hypothetical protein
MNLERKYKGVYFNSHSIHNEFAISIMNTCSNVLIDKEGKI